MSDLVIHPTTAAALEAWKDGQHHALLLVGSRGSGKASLAGRLASELLHADAVEHPYVRWITPETGLGIEAVQGIGHFLRLKVPGKEAVDRIVIIEDAHHLTGEAQNALLKTLEEPPAGTRLILTAADEQALLPTIRSRVQAVTVNRPVATDLQHYFEQQFNKAEVERATRISGGLPGLMHALLDNEDHPLKPAIELARELLQQSSYERLARVDELSKQKELTQDTLEVLQHMAELSLQQADGKAAQRWQHILKASYEASEALAGSGQPKLVLTELMLNF
jgi:DNA polymerase-3 subunit delta'